MSEPNKIDRKKKPDFYSGIPWEYVTPEQAYAHPMGRPGLVIWLIVAYLLGLACVKFYLSLSYGAGFGIAILNSIWPLLAGIGLAMRVPWSIVMVMISAGFTIYALMQGMRGDGTLITLLETIANVGILFYLLDGDRPNLIYRHRYRKYSQQPGSDA